MPAITVVHSVRRKRKNDGDNQNDREQQCQLDVINGCRDGLRPVHDDIDVDAGRYGCPELGQRGLNVADNRNDVRIRLFGNDQQDSALVVLPRCNKRVLRTVNRPPDIANAHR